MTSTFIARLKDKQGRIYIDKAAREFEGLQLGDYIEVTIKKLDKPKTAK